MTFLRRFFGLLIASSGLTAMLMAAASFQSEPLPTPLREASDIIRDLAAPALPWVALSMTEIAAAGFVLMLAGGVLVALPKRGATRALPAPAKPAPAADKAPPVPRPPTDPIDRQFLPAALELLETPPSPINMAALWLICIGFATALCFLYFGKLDIHAVATGRIQPSGRSKVVQPLEAGRVVSIAVDNGRVVAAGDLLLELDPTETGADREALTRDFESYSAESARRKVAADAVSAGRFTAGPVPFGDQVSEEIRRRETAVLRSELSELSANVASLQAQIEERRATRLRLMSSIDARSRLLALTNERVKMRTELTDVGALSRALVIDSLQQHESQMITQASEQGQLAETEAALKTLQKKIEETINHFIVDQTQKLIEAERKSDRASQELIKARSKNDRTAIRAPIAGTVQQLAVTTVGQVVLSGQALLTIVPTNAQLEIEAQIANLDIGFVAVGQPAVVKVEAFPFTRYGTLGGRVVKVSSDAVDEREARALVDPNANSKPQSGTPQSNAGQTLVFPATIALDRWTIDVDGKDISLTPGMAVTIEVLTGQRRAIDYILSPLREVTSRAARER